MRQGSRRTTSLPANSFVKVILKDKDKDESKILPLFTATNGHSQEGPSTVNRLEHGHGLPKGSILILAVTLWVLFFLPIYCSF